MAQQNIYLGAVAEDGTGDSPRVAGDKINDNFTELYATKTLVDGTITPDVTTLQSDVSTLQADLANTSSAMILAIKAMMYPVGCVYTELTGTNPNTTFGFGTWTSFGSGRTLVGVDAGQTEFNTVEKTGGAKTHTLTINEMPAHPHTQDNMVNINHIVVGGSTTIFTGQQISGTKNTGSAGGGQAHNNLQPYITVYFWKRTA